MCIRRDAPVRAKAPRRRDARLPYTSSPFTLLLVARERCERGGRLLLLAEEAEETASETQNENTEGDTLAEDPVKA